MGIGLPPLLRAQRSELTLLSETGGVQLYLWRNPVLALPVLSDPQKLQFIV